MIFFIFKSSEIGIKLNSGVPHGRFILSAKLMCRDYIVTGVETPS
jgi:hypothetical protein